MTEKSAVSQDSVIRQRYKNANESFGPKGGSICFVESSEGNLLPDHKDILKRWLLKMLLRGMSLKEKL